MTCVLVIAALCSGPSPVRADPDWVYVYPGASGRLVYVNQWSKVPKAKQAAARRIDLSEISLNADLARELSQQADQTLEKVEQDQAAPRTGAINVGGQQGARCVSDEPRGAAEWWRWAWQRHGYLVLIGGLCLALLIASPAIGRRVGAGRWSRLMMLVLPLLGIIAVVSYSMVRARDALSASEACAAEAEAGKRIQVPGSLEALEKLQRLEEGVGVGASHEGADDEGGWVGPPAADEAGRDEP